ncbi:uroporphyrinogen-III C-methyltransferase [Tomitella fengzijianii]|uniref:uroporphyrinogen-III C-methyltransferase n=1 Tax=Tomitella fengzijianii TaxID=2597660 RepID=UPI00143CCCAD|nr:uroporphyrinogen-III C-methyltransferase [Tomitella fengzijianii]
MTDGTVPGRPGADAGEPAYLAGLRLRGRLVVVVGGGSVVQRRLPLLLDSGALVTVVSPVVTAAVEALVSAGRVRHVARDYRPGDLADAWYVIVATDDPAVNAAAAAEAEERRTFCVRSDAGTRGSAVTPATTRHGDVTVGVVAHGDHRRSAALRTALRGALQSGLAAAGDGPARAGVALIGGGPGDPELITVRGRRLLARADVVVADHLAPAQLLAELAPGTEVVDASKLPYGRSMQQEQINALLIEHARAGRFVARLKGGDPYVFGRGFEELLACADAGVPVTVVPGITSAFSVPSAADVPVTHRGVAHEVVVVSGHLPPGHADSLVDWDALGRLSGTVVILMGVRRLQAFAEALIAAGRPAGTPAAIIQEGTTAHQRVVRAPLSEIARRAEEAGVRPPAVTVIGPVVDVGASVRTRGSFDA